MQQKMDVMTVLEQPLDVRRLPLENLLYPIKSGIGI